MHLPRVLAGLLVAMGAGLGTGMDSVLVGDEESPALVPLSTYSTLRVEGRQAREETQRVKAMREALGVAQHEVAAVCGWSHLHPHAPSHIEGRSLVGHPPLTPQAKAICRQWLMGRGLYPDVLSNQELAHILQHHFHVTWRPEDVGGENEDETDHEGGDREYGDRSAYTTDGVESENETKESYVLALNEKTENIIEEELSLLGQIEKNEEFLDETEKENYPINEEEKELVTESLNELKDRMLELEVERTIIEEEEAKVRQEEEEEVEEGEEEEEEEEKEEGGRGKEEEEEEAEEEDFLLKLDRNLENEKQMLLKKAESKEELLVDMGKNPHLFTETQIDSLRQSIVYIQNRILELEGYQIRIKEEIASEVLGLMNEAKEEGEKKEGEETIEEEEEVVEEEGEGTKGKDDYSEEYSDELYYSESEADSEESEEDLELLVHKLVEHPRYEEGALLFAGKVIEKVGETEIWKEKEEKEKQNGTEEGKFSHLESRVGKLEEQVVKQELQEQKFYHLERLTEKFNEILKKGTEQEQRFSYLEERVEKLNEMLGKEHEQKFAHLMKRVDKLEEMLSTLKDMVGKLAEKEDEGKKEVENEVKTGEKETRTVKEKWELCPGFLFPGVTSWNGLRMSEKEVTPPPGKGVEFSFGEWTLRVAKNHIMGSQCESLSSNPCTPDTPLDSLCNLCIYERELSLPSLPDMVFADNLLEVRHAKGGSIMFTPLDALRCVNNTCDTLQVAHAQTWKEARADCEFANKVVKPYDWTYTTDYRGTLTPPLHATSTSQRIDLDKLRVREEIKFYDEIFLYEDELDDNGCTRCVVKVRVMPSGFFVVFRHYLRVDQVIVRVNDTRLYSPAGESYILRESSTREAPISSLKVDSSVYGNPDLVWQYLPLVKEEIDKLVTSS